MEMKKFIYILPYTLLLIACHHDLLETVPTDRLSQSIFWQTETDAIYGSNSVYRYLDGLMVKYDGLTDVLHANVQFSDAASLERGDFNSQFAMIQEEWTEHYKGIRAANNFLENVDKVEAVNPDLIPRL